MIKPSARIGLEEAALLDSEIELTLFPPKTYPVLGLDRYLDRASDDALDLAGSLFSMVSDLRKFHTQQMLSSTMRTMLKPLIISECPSPSSLPSRQWSYSHPVFSSPYLYLDHLPR